MKFCEKFTYGSKKKIPKNNFGEFYVIIVKMQSTVRCNFVRIEGNFMIHFKET